MWRQWPNTIITKKMYPPIKEERTEQNRVNWHRNGKIIQHATRLKTCSRLIPKIGITHQVLEIKNTLHFIFLQLAKERQAELKMEVLVNFMQIFLRLKLIKTVSGVHLLHLLHL